MTAPHIPARSEYEYHSGEATCTSNYILPALKELLAQFGDDIVVADMGCGNGSMLAGAAKSGWTMHGLEASLSGIAQGRRHYPQITFHHVGLSDTTPPIALTGRCDIVISTEVIEHVFLPRILIANCHSLLKPGGTLVISTPYHGYLKNLVLALAGKWDGHLTPLWDYGHIKFWSYQTLSTLLIQAGFEVHQFKGVGRFPYLWKSMILVATKPATALS